MGVTKYLYSFGYRHFRVPWDSGPRKHLVELVESGRLKPCRTIDLGSGTASNCIFLAQHGFEVTGVDFAAGAVELGRQRAAETGVEVHFVEDDLTDLRHVSGTFDLLVDYGTLDDLASLYDNFYMTSCKEEKVAPGRSAPKTQVVVQRLANTLSVRLACRLVTPSMTRSLRPSRLQGKTPPLNPPNFPKTEDIVSSPWDCRFAILFYRIRKTHLRQGFAHDGSAEMARDRFREYGNRHAPGRSVERR
jgi:SAM-dependent methyltransferase